MRELTIKGVDKLSHAMPARLTDRSKAFEYYIKFCICLSLSSYVLYAYS